MPDKFRIGSVSYLNAAPLIFDLERRSFDSGRDASGVDYELIKAVPSELSRGMAAGELDVAMMPIIDYCAGAGACLVPNIAIACLNFVASVLVFSSKRLSEIETIGCVTASRSSAALLRVLMREKWDIHPTLVPFTGSDEEILAHHDAALVIGDGALQLRKTSGCRVYDLGAEWVELTGHPFVFAAWVLAKESAEMAPLVQLLLRAKESGLRRLPEVIDAHLGVAGMDRDALEQYFSENINYDFTDRHLEGVKRFQGYCQTHGLLTGESRELAFFSG